MSELIESIERRQLRREIPRFRVGDRIRVHFEVVEGTRRRTQMFEGVVMKLQGSGARRTFTVRKLSFGIGVERTFPLHSPKIQGIDVVARGEVRRAKLYYLRGRIGRRARVKERRDFAPEELAPAVLPDEQALEPAAGDGAAEVSEAEGEGAEAAEEEVAEAAEEEVAETAEGEVADAGAEEAEPVPAGSPPEEPVDETGDAAQTDESTTRDGEQ